MRERVCVREKRERLRQEEEANNHSHGNEQTTRGRECTNKPLNGCGNCRFKKFLMCLKILQWCKEREEVREREKKRGRERKREEERGRERVRAHRFNGGVSLDKYPRLKKSKHENNPSLDATRAPSCAFVQSWVARHINVS